MLAGAPTGVTCTVKTHRVGHDTKVFRHIDHGNSVDDLR